MDFPDLDAYIDAYRRDRSLAVLPVTVVADYLDLTPAGVVARMNVGTLREIRIGKAKFVGLISLIEGVDAEREDLERIEKFLAENAARGVASVPYGPVMELVGLNAKLSADRRKIGRLLGRVSRRSYEKKKVLLSVLVHVKGTNAPSLKGFFSLVDVMDPDWSDTYGEEEYVARETKRVLKAYRASGRAASAAE